ncbi:MAG: DnaD domain protein [Anaerolineae bacterium]|nr:DnaD domain protein [Anaerolineae bacterium]
MEKFAGFPNRESSSSWFQELILPQLLHGINDLDELKMSIFAYLVFARQEGSVPFIRLEEFLSSPDLMTWIDEKRLETILKQVLSRGTLLIGQLPDEGHNRYLFPNIPTAHVAIQRLRDGSWIPETTDHLPLTGAVGPTKNIYTLYEENIGPLTPMLSQDITAALDDYPLTWIEEAIHIAVQNNARSWRYIDAILQSWKKEGKHADTRRNSKKDGRRISTGEFDEFIQH